MSHRTTERNDSWLSDTDLNGRGMRIGIVVASFNEAVGEQLLTATHQTLLELGLQERDIVVARVPGALEIPLALQTLARAGRFDALIALGCVVRGETYHFEVVANESAAGITRVQLDHDLPVANGILTVEDDAQAFLRSGSKGRDCALVAVEMAQMMRTIRAGVL